MSLQLKSELNYEQLKLQLIVLKEELNQIEFKTEEFEAILRAHLINEIIEEQELTILYKQQKAAKKLKRQAQKKNYTKQESIVVAKNNEKSTAQHTEENTLRKQLYREAMLQVHPDKFSMQEDKQDLASEITIQLIDIYTNGSLEALQAFHQHIFSGNALSNEKINSETPSIQDNYLENEILRIKDLIIKAKQKHTYLVLTEYEDPMSFLNELQAYYADRLFKLRKRTRSK